MGSGRHLIRQQPVRWEKGGRELRTCLRLPQKFVDGAIRGLIGQLEPENMVKQFFRDHKYGFKIIFFNFFLMLTV